MLLGGRGPSVSTISQLSIRKTSIGMFAQSFIVSSTTDMVRSKEHDITCLFGPLQPGVDCNGSVRGASLTHSPPYASAAILKSIMRQRSIHEMMLQRSLYTIELLLERMTVSKDGCTNYILAASQSVADAISDVTLRKCVRFDAEDHDSTGRTRE